MLASIALRVRMRRNLAGQDLLAQQCGLPTAVKSAGAAPRRGR